MSLLAAFDGHVTYQMLQMLHSLIPDVLDYCFLTTSAVLFINATTHLILLSPLVLKASVSDFRLVSLEVENSFEKVPDREFGPQLLDKRDHRITRLPEYEVTEARFAGRPDHEIGVTGLTAPKALSNQLVSHIGF